MCTLWRPVRILVDLYYISARSFVQPVDSLPKTIVDCGKRIKDGLIAGLSLGSLPSVAFNKSSALFLLITICELMLLRDLIGCSEKLDFTLSVSVILAFGLRVQGF